MSRNAFAGLVIEDDDEPTVPVVRKPKVAAAPAVAPVAAAPAPAAAAAPAKKTTTYDGTKQRTHRPRPANEDGSAPSQDRERTPRATHEKRPPRDYKNERQSHNAQGNPHAEKRHGRGAFNSGTAQDELKAQEDAKKEIDQTKAEAATEVAADATPAADAAAEPAVEAAPAAPAEPEGPKTLTLEEFKRQQQAIVKAAKPKRQANEGVDVSQWGNTQELKREAEEKQSAGEAKQGNSQRSARKQHVDIALSFGSGFEPRPDSGRGESRGGMRGGRGGNRGGRGGNRGAPRGGNNGSLNVASEVDFPAL